MIALCASLLALALAAAAAPAAPAAAADFNGTTDVTLFLYTLNNRDAPERLEIGNDAASPSFNSDRITKVFIHGWIASAAKYAAYPSEYFDNGLDYNIVLVDWQKGAADLDTSVSSNTSILVGEYVGEVLNHFVAGRGLDLDRLFIVGHSMGAQVAGVVGNRVGGGAAEVVGLDPAFNMYEGQPLANQIDPSDARFVQVIHSNAGHVGIPYTRGHVDFFPNGGSGQAGCSSDECSHNIIIDFYLESIASRDFVASRCGNYEAYLQGRCRGSAHAVMGEGTPLSSERGTYYLVTNSASPYAEGDIGL